MSSSSTSIGQNPNGNTIVIAIVVPACFVILLMALLILHDSEAARKEERMQKRRDELESNIKTQHFYDWLATQKEKHPDSGLTTDPVW
ncbi:hypothetical protein N0V94_008473 [Neodidymelliopsis sp. IMI 364377]|nr:hypothetical protein N0V94_008473 [Neodidymelliopsis sp. IMI 364377]